MSGNSPAAPPAVVGSSTGMEDMVNLATSEGMKGIPESGLWNEFRDSSENEAPISDDETTSKSSKEDDDDDIDGFNLETTKEMETSASCVTCLEHEGSTVESSQQSENATTGDPAGPMSNNLVDESMFHSETPWELSETANGKNDIFDQAEMCVLGENEKEAGEGLKSKSVEVHTGSETNCEDVKLEDTVTAGNMDPSHFMDVEQLQTVVHNMQKKIQFLQERDEQHTEQNLELQKRTQLLEELDKGKTEKILKLEREINELKERNERQNVLSAPNSLPPIKKKRGRKSKAEKMAMMGIVNVPVKQVEGPKKKRGRKSKAEKMAMMRILNVPAKQVEGPKKKRGRKRKHRNNSKEESAQLSSSLEQCKVEPEYTQSTSNNLVYEIVGSSCAEERTDSRGTKLANTTAESSAATPVSKPHPPKIVSPDITYFHEATKVRLEFTTDTCTTAKRPRGRPRKFPPGMTQKDYREAAKKRKEEKRLRSQQMQTIAEEVHVAGVNNSSAVSTTKPNTSSPIDLPTAGSLKRKPHQCRKCYKTFATVQARCVHLRSVHDGKRWRCRYCKKSFKYPGGCRKHEISAHSPKNENGERVYARKMKKRFDASARKTYKCRICKEIFNSIHDRFTHLETCGNILKSSDETTDAEFRCTICGIPVRTRSGLARHMKGYHHQLLPNPIKPE